MDIKKEKLEDFKTAISSTVKSLSNFKKIEVSFGNQASKSDQNLIKLPDLNEYGSKFNFEEIRAVADSKSLRLRFSDIKVFKKYEPEGNISKKLYEISEKIRCEKIGISYFSGVKKNIEKFYKQRISSLDLKSSEDKMIESFENFLRTNFLDFKNETEIEKKLKSYKKDINNQFSSKISELKESAIDQEKFNSIISKIISEMSLDENINEEEKRDEENENNDKQSKPQDIERKTKETEEKNEEMSIESGIPDLENETRDSDKSNKEVELEDNTRPDLKKRNYNNGFRLPYFFGILTITMGKSPYFYSLFDFFHNLLKISNLAANVMVILILII